MDHESSDHEIERRQNQKQKQREEEQEEQQQQQRTRLHNMMVKEQVERLKRVLEREYLSFFNPMERMWYSPSVTFVDPLTSLVGVDSYQSNVDMLASRTFMGRILFDDASIDLHSITGGDVDEVDDDDDDKCIVSVSDIQTRWTLRVTAKILPWKPTARFSGISVYQIQVIKAEDEDEDMDEDEEDDEYDDENDRADSDADENSSSSSSKTNKLNIRIVAQQDYWDSINLMGVAEKGGGGGRDEDDDDHDQDGRKELYRSLLPSKVEAIRDFWDQLKPDALVQAREAAPELPYQLLRRGRDYDVRRYPPYTYVKIKYGRRDEGFGSLGAFTKGVEALAPAIMTVPNDEEGASDKYMAWPLTYKKPTDDDDDGTENSSSSSSSSSSSLRPPSSLVEKSTTDPQWKKCRLGTTSSDTVVAVGTYTDASVGPVVRKADSELRRSLERDGLTPSYDSARAVTFAQYDAIFSMGRRRGEVWIELEPDSHPWARDR